MKKIAMLGAVAALGLTAPLVSTASASAAEPGLQWREVTSSSSDQIDRLCWQTQHVWDPEGLTDVPCTPAAKTEDGKWVSYYAANTGDPAPAGLESREVSSSSADQIDRLCWQTQHVWDAQAVADVPCTKAAQRDGKFYAYYLADTGKAA